MVWLKNLIGTLGFRTTALRALADSQAVSVGIVCHIAGYLAYALVRSVVYISLPEFSQMYVQGGLSFAGLGTGLVQGLIFLLLLFVPAVVALSNAFSDDGLGLSFTVAEYRAHIAVLFPLWGAVYLVTAPLQWPLQHSLVFGYIIEVEISMAYLLRSLLLVLYTFWAVMRLNYLSPVKTIGIFALSMLTAPIFAAIYLFIRSLPFLLLILLFYPVARWIRNLGIGRTGTGDFQRNMRTLTINPQNADAHYQLGRISLDRGNPDTAREHFDAAVKITQHVAEYYYYFGIACERKKDWGKALECYEKAYRLDPEYGQGDIFREVGKAYLNTGSVEKGKEFLTFFLSRRDADPEGRYWLADALVKSGDTTDARIQLSMVLEQARENPRFFRKRNREWIYRARNLLRETKGREWIA